MIQEEKSLLLKDFCARLPYGMKAQVCERNDEDGSYFYNDCKILGFRSNSLVEFIRIDDLGKEYGRSDWFNISWFKPYLFPMPDIQDKSLDELDKLITNKEFYEIINIGQDWFNAHHFDCRGLIKMGLAIDCTNLNIY